MRTLANSAEVLAVDVTCTEDALSVTLSDGRTVTAPLAWFPRRVRATPKQRRDWELIGGGVGIHWEVIDEDISVASLLKPESFMRLPGDQSPSAGRTRTRKPKKGRARAIRG